MNIAQKIFLHSIVWVAILIIFVFLGVRNGDYHQAIIIFVYFGIFNIAIFYLNYLYILPKYLSKRKYWMFSACIVLLVLISGLLKYGFAFLFRDVILISRDGQIPFERYYIGAIFTGLFFIFLSTAFKFAVDWFLNEKVRKNLESEKLIAELAFLRSQINPHFLFNSLNNIYSLAYQKSDKAPEAIMKLSEIMRYMLQESNEPRVQLGREIRYLENYIELQKLRFKGQAYIELSISGDYGEQSIAPLILISFVENAFKHGVASDPDNPIKISVRILNNQLHFEIQNKKSLLNKDESSGIGLSNVKRRLDLLYVGKYALDIEEDLDTYYCKLDLNL
ncbi:sensor histidine kinase [Paradesertivirga mongoliensis]|uniref:Sensor histidine kinase n=1 Tax=Paradesertivirga mongoliensis TaxID=2100740 RepID=A0ABW4ZIX3_9SPHI|nr:histidine kinase [Pedobacter mongoliensis]